MNFQKKLVEAALRLKTKIFPIPDTGKCEIYTFHGQSEDRMHRVGLPPIVIYDEFVDMNQAQIEALLERNREARNP